MPGHVMQAVLSSRWAMTEEALRQLVMVAGRYQHDLAAAASAREAWEAVQATRGEPLEGSHGITLRDGIATIELRGPLVRYGGFFSDISGLTSTERFARDVMEAATNPAVKAILLAINSPGGEVDGTQEVAEIVYQARGTKPIWAHVSGEGASAAYWIASAVDPRRIHAGPTAILGSIGVRAAFVDWSEWEKKQGVRTIEIVSSQSPRKSIDPATETGRADIQVILDELAEVFVQTTARNRGITRDAVIENYGAGGVFVGARAVEAGLADGLATYEEVHAALLEFTSQSTRRSLLMGSATPTTLPTADAPMPDPQDPASADEPTPAAEPAATEAPTTDPAQTADAIATAAATAERERIASIERLARPGAASIIAAAKQDPTMTAEKTALAILEAENTRRTRLLGALQRDVEVDPAPRSTPTNETDGLSAAGRSLMSTLHRMNSERAAAQRTP